jgi:hypothetical protein
MAGLRTVRDEGLIQLGSTRSVAAVAARRYRDNIDEAFHDILNVRVYA